MDRFTQAAVDLLKYQVIKQVDTGDKTFDSLIVVLCTILIGLCSTWLTNNVIKKCKSTYNKLRIKMMAPPDGIIPYKLLQLYYDDDLDIKKLRYKIIIDNEKSLQLMREWIGKNFPMHINNSCTQCIISLPQCTTNIEEHIRETGDEDIAAGIKKMPVYLLDGNICYFHTDHDKFGIYSDNLLACKQLMKLIYEHYSASEKWNINLIKKIYKIDNTGKLIFLQDMNKHKSFDNIITKHKAHIFGYVDRFVKGNLYGVSSNWIPNNLGIIMHGKPGTGKTSMIKAICNHANRHPILVDLRIVNSVDVLEKIFRQYSTKDYAIVLEEIDFMAGVLTRTKTNNFDEQNDLEHMKRVQLFTDINCTNDNEIKQKLLEQYNNLPRTRNKLDLSVLLQLLDGLVERNNGLVIATTNCIELIDSALLRPGRFDLVIKLDYFNQDEIIELIKKIINPSDEQIELINDNKYAEYVWSPLKIIQLILIKKDLKEILQALSMPPEAH